MRLCKLEDIVGNEKLARPVMTKDYMELLAAGTILKPEYIARLEAMGIEEVLIDDSKMNPAEIQLLRDDVDDLFSEKVKSVLERHVYNDSAELEKLTAVAEDIINNILSIDELVEQIFDIKERSADIYEHSISVCALSVLMAAKYELSKKEMHDIGVAALFHDIGLRYVEFKYDNQSLDELSEKELIDYKKHPVYAFTSLENEPWISKESKDYILKHHECLDGSGYPFHAKSMNLPSQILEVCDAFDEMICGIGCKRSKVYEAVEYMKICKGVKYSEEIVDKLLDFTAVYPAGSIVVLNTGEWAVVIRQNKQFPERPVLQIIKDKDGKSVEKAGEFNLLENLTAFVEKVIM